MDKLWITEGPREFEKWISRENVDPAAVTRIREGLEITAEGRIAEVAGEQDPEVYFPGLTARPWWSRGDFPWVTGLEAAAGRIRQEFRAFGSHTNDSSAPTTGLASDGAWRAVYLSCIGKPHAVNIAAFPETLSSLSPIPGATGCGMTYFSTVEGGSHIAAHTGFTNAHLRCHLSLVSTDGSRIRVGAEERNWEEGKALVFDDSFEHEVWNEGSERRTVLLFDFWHPALSEIEIEAVTYMMGVWRRMFSRHFWTRQMASDNGRADAVVPGMV
jgi:hypothetical protein